MNIINTINKIKRRISSILIHKRINLNLNEPIISFTFDDVPNSGFENGMKILKKYGYSGTYYISLGIKDNNNSEKPYFDRKYLQEVIDGGGELACHTFNHIHLYKANYNEVKTDLEKNQKTINELIPEGYTFKNFSYPYGEQSFTSKNIIRNRYQTARGVQMGLNLGQIDLYNLKACSMEENLGLTMFYESIDNAIKLKGWLILFAHDVEKNHSEWGCTPEFFESIVKYCYDKKLKVLTIEKAVESFGIK